MTGSYLFEMYVHGFELKELKYSVQRTSQLHLTLAAVQFTRRSPLLSEMAVDEFK